MVENGTKTVRKMRNVRKDEKCAEKGETPVKPVGRRSGNVALFISFEQK